MSNLYLNIKALCDDRGITGGRMCEDLGFSRSMLTDLKAGRKTGITMLTAQKIADYFNVPLSTVLDGRMQEPVTNIYNEQLGNIDLRELLGLILTLSPVQMKQVLDFVRFIRCQSE